MRLRLKSTGFSLTPSLQTIVSEKLLEPAERRLAGELPEDATLDVELAKVTRHHLEGKIWKCEVNLALPHDQRTIYVEVLSESLEAAVDGAKDELERQISGHKGRRFSKFLRAARRLKEEVRGVYRWFRR